MNSFQTQEATFGFNQVIQPANDDHLKAQILPLLDEAKPFVKWVGGKRQLLPELNKRLPDQFNNYHETFIGGGAMFFDLQPNNAVINDWNPELVNLYRVVRDNPTGLMAKLDEHNVNKTSKEYFLTVRGMDRDMEVFNNMTKVDRAARFIFLNKTAFNGLWRVNSKQQHNVSFGDYKNPTLYDRKNILACSSLLQTTDILNGDFENVKERVQPGDLVYLDPPYVPLSATSSFVGYTDKGFDANDQIRLKEMCDYIDSIGAYFMLSNSSAGFVYELYQEHNIHEVMASRAVNCKGDGRGKVKEVIVTNY